jgi:predicted nucleic acid-binding protein
VDATALAVGFVKQQPVISDDKNMCTVANALGIEVWSLLQLLKLMLDEGHIGLDTAKTIAQFLDYENDLPCGKVKFIKQFKQFFNAEPFE